LGAADPSADGLPQAIPLFPSIGYALCAPVRLRLKTGPRRRRGPTAGKFQHRIPASWTHIDIDIRRGDFHIGQSRRDSATFSTRPSFTVQAMREEIELVCSFRGGS
jgi:hypothetical protein